VILTKNRLSPFNAVVVSYTVSIALVFTLALPRASFGAPLPSSVFSAIDPSEDFFHYALSEDSIAQAATIGALMGGLYDGEVTFAQLKQNGDFGVGTVDKLDGELIVLDGKFCHARADGLIYPLADTDKTPFASVTFFKPEVTYNGVEGLSYAQLEKTLSEMVPTPNYIYAFKISGTFSYIQTRCVRKQEKPYLPLTEAVKSQAFSEMSNVEGTIMGFWSPAYMTGLNITGYHLHFITQDLKAGGHLVDCMIEKANIEIDYKYAVHMVLPTSPEFYNADLSVEGLDLVERPKSNLRYFQKLK
jgi:acetolactate decarboxylase